MLLSLNNAEYNSVPDVVYPGIGTISLDQSAIAGRESWLFLYKGSNHYYQGYYPHATHSVVAEQWIQLIKSREQRLANKDIEFLQVIVPNKASILPTHYPLPMPSHETFILKQITNLCSSRLLCPLMEWRTDPYKESVFRRNDSHLTVLGNAHLAESILSAFGIVLRLDRLIDTSSVVHVGDLGVKYTPGVSELLQAPCFDSGLLDLSCVSKVYEYFPELGFNGIKQAFRSLDPLCSKKILIFGNSFFERCPSWGLTPIFAALFKETHFAWTPEIDYDVVDQIMPDIVIAQTCERFLPRVPIY